MIVVARVAHSVDGMWSERYVHEVQLRHHRAPSPIHFPWSEKVPESKRHLKLRTFLATLLELELRGRAAIGCDQFVYWNASNPKRCLAPDVFVRLGTEDSLFRSWKTWEGGAPQLAIEIADRGVRVEDWAEKLARYHELGVSELVRYDADEPTGSRVRAWDRVEDDLVERVVEGDATPCATLGLHLVIGPHPEIGSALRLARDPAGEELLLTAEEAAQRKIAELEAELRKRG
ncbi:MAG: Uma2 family endonuclease [Polyangiales bacterium]